MLRFAALVLFGIVAFIFSLNAGAVAAPVPKHLMKKPGSGQGKFQGKWKVQSVLIGEKDLLTSLGPNCNATVHFQDDRFSATIHVGHTTNELTATVKYGTDSTKRPRTVELRDLTDSRDLTNPGQPGDVFGYTFEGEKLLLGSPGLGGKRIVDPRKPGPDDIVLVLVRAK